MSLNVHTADLHREEGDVLSTRESGREVGRRAFDAANDNNQHLLLSFFGVDVASTAFLDELLTAVHPLTMGGESGRLLVAVGLTDDVREAFEMVLERRKLMMATLDDNHVELLGGADVLRETVKAAIELGETTTAPDLADHLDVKLTALHQRLKALTDSGVFAQAVERTGERGTRRAFHNPTTAEIKQAAQTLLPA